MASNTFGLLYRLTSFGESHGKGIGGIIDGLPSGWKPDMDRIQYELNRRRPGQSRLTTPRNEADKVEILSGMMDGFITGTPLAFVVWNTDQRSGDYGNLEKLFRPSHADYTYQQKYGIRDHRGGGRSSARETIARVVAGSFAKQYLAEQGIRVQGYVNAIGTVEMTSKPGFIPDEDQVESSIVRCPDEIVSKEMERLIDEARAEGDTLGGVVRCHILGLPVGLGEPVFDKLHADLGKAMLSINAVKGFEYGSGFEGTRRRGSVENDPFLRKDGAIHTASNHSGGIQGGISNGEEVYMNVGFKPVATIMKSQNTVDQAGNEIVMQAKGRHDVCVVPRAVVIVEAMAAMVVMDHLLRWNAYRF